MSGRQTLGAAHVGNAKQGHAVTGYPFAVIVLAASNERDQVMIAQTSIPRAFGVVDGMRHCSLEGTLARDSIRIPVRMQSRSGTRSRLTLVAQILSAGRPLKLYDLETALTQQSGHCPRAHCSDGYVSQELSVALETQGRSPGDTDV